MLEEKTGGQLLERKIRSSVKPEMQELFFDLANFKLILNNLHQSTTELRKILIKYSGASGATLMFLDKYGYLWKTSEKTTFPFKLGVGVAGLAAQNKRTLYIKNIKNDDRFKVLGERRSNSAMIAKPIIKNSNVLGVLNLTYSKKAIENFPPDKALLDIFANKVEDILENVTYFHNINIDRNELIARRDINRIMESQVSLNQKLEEIRKKIINYIKINDISFLFYDPKLQNSVYTISSAKRKKLKRIELTNKLAEIFQSKQGVQDFVDVSDCYSTFSKDKNKLHITTYPIFSGSRIAAFILIKDQMKNIDNFSTYERNLFRLTSSRIGKYLAREQFSKKIIEEKERWRLIFHNVDDGILLISQDKKIIEANPKAREILGTKKKSLSGQDLFSLFKIINSDVSTEAISSIRNINKFQRVDEIALTKKIDSFFKTGKNIRPKEYYIETKNGKFWIEISMNTALRRWGESVFGVVHIRNVTKRKELEQDKNEFMSMVSHELRTPLSAMNGFLSMILNNDYGSLNERQIKSLSRIAESNERMVNLVEDILDVSRIELGKYNLNKEAVNIADLIYNVIQDLNTKIKSKKIEVKLSSQNRNINLKKNTRLSKNNTDIYVLADRDRMIQIMQNLIDNAIKYTLEKGNIGIHLTTGEKFVEIKVLDNGVGISPEDQAKLFKRFSRIHNPLSIQAGGTGLGLYITKKLITAHGGQIDVKSTPQKGTIFTVKMPVAKQLPLI